MRARAADIGPLLADGNSDIHICGHKRMEDGVGEVFADICAGHGLDWRELLPELQRSGRFHVETYF